MLEIFQYGLDLDLGAASSFLTDDETNYQASVKKFIPEVIGEVEVDAMFLLGEQNKDQRFREVVNEILLVRENGKRFEQVMGGFGKDMGDGLWYGGWGGSDHR